MKDILDLGEGPTQGLDDAKRTAKAKCSIDFARSRRKFFCLHYNGSNSLFIC